MTETLCVFVTALVTAFVTTLVVDTNWQRDCEYLGKHFTNSKVYECKVVK